MTQHRSIRFLTVPGTALVEQRPRCYVYSVNHTGVEEGRAVRLGLPIEGCACGDTFSIELVGGAYNGYTRAGYIQGGNVQVES